MVLERAGGGFGSGSHPTTRMCLALLLDLPPAGGAADLGCGLGTLAISAARAGWAPVLGVDRMPGAVAAARATARATRSPWSGANRTRGGAGPARRAGPGQRPAAGPRPGRGRAGRGAAPRAVVASGLVAAELPAAARRYAAAGWTIAAALEEEGWTAVRLERAGA